MDVAASSIKKGDITEIRAFTNPPKNVMTVLSAVHVLMHGVTADWNTLKKEMKDVNKYLASII